MCASMGNTGAMKSNIHDYVICMYVCYVCIHGKIETQRLVEKLADMELFMREEICEKKKKIYNQQKHYTKKTMYADDKGQAISKSKRYQPSTVLMLNYLLLVVVCSVCYYYYFYRIVCMYVLYVYVCY